MIGRLTKALVSAYNRSRVQVARIRQYERRVVAADFNGAIDPARTIQSVTWRCTSPWVTKMSAPAINGREVQVTVDFQSAGASGMKATATLDNGEIYSQVFDFTVVDSPWFSDPEPISAGPYSITASAE